MRLLFVTCLFVSIGYAQAQEKPINWVHISSKTGGIEAPNGGTEQTSSAVADFDNDGINDFCITERKQTPCMVWYRRTDKGWDKYVVESDPMSPEAGTVAFDVDGDGDMDIIAGGDGGKTKEVYWWENPYPDFERDAPWKRHLIYKGGAKYHDQIVGDFDGDGKPDLVFWSQTEHELIWVRIPDNPKDYSAWKCTPVYKYYDDGQMQQHGRYADFKGVNEHAVKAIQDFNRFGTTLKKAGLRFYYHPHGYEFNTPDGNLMDLILEQTKPELVTFELDVFWATHGGADPLAYLKKYPGRFELIHLKEIGHDVPGNNTGSAPDETSVSLGRGVTDWPRLLRIAQKMGTKKYYIEDEAKNALDQVPLSIKYLETLK
ncbi:MAG: FG-GAP-like repeat-containing protein [Bacteroidales bacterium]